MRLKSEKYILSFLAVHLTKVFFCGFSSEQVHLGSSALLLAGHDQSIRKENFTIYQSCLYSQISELII